MRVLLVTGVFPPDIGGPATHAADLRDELVARGHRVELLSLTDEPVRSRGVGIDRLPRRWPWPVRNALATAFVAIRGRRCDAVYATGLGPPAVAGALLARRPVVLKVVGDPAWERATRQGRTHAAFDDFQRESSRSVAVRGMKWLRKWTTRHATAVITPSEQLREAVCAWSGREDVLVVSNGVRVDHTITAPRSAAPGLTVLFVGRLIPLKRVELIIEGVAGTPDALLDIVGDGPEASALRRCAETNGVSSRVRFVGATPHDDVLTRMRAADVLALASSHEGQPHVLIEALAAGTPVVATVDAGKDLVTDDSNGVLVDGNAEAFAAVFRDLAADRQRLARLGEGAAASGREWTIERCADRIERILDSVTAPMPRAVFLAKGALTLDGDQRAKYTIHRRYLESVVICAGARFRREESPGVRVVALPTPRPKLVSTPLFYVVAPLAAVALATGRRRSAIVCKSPYEAVGTLALSRMVPRRFRPRVQVELHGDWHTATRLYGSEQRRHLSGVSDPLARWAVREADRVRVVSPWLGRLARQAGYRGTIDTHVAYSNFGPFFDPPPRPLPSQPRVLFAGALEGPKAVEVLLEAWPSVLEHVPGARLSIVGAGSDRDRLCRQIERDGLSATVTMIEPVSRSELRTMLDGAWCVCLPSRSEGLGRILLEAMAAGRAVVATRVGGPEDLVADHENGRLAAPDDPSGLASALVDVIRSRAVAEQMGAEGRRRAEARDPVAEYESGIERLSHWIAS